ncbi:hypothetical protein LJR219_000932 [Phenylobacterium sp. LjRoot219]|uniref:DUF3617 domain-containing protein n=1 Tax=Phenylobacterium sp. LjRoot219 TaxID=3342283 RepID=UPI003ED05C3D
MRKAQILALAGLAAALVACDRKPETAPPKLPAPPNSGPAASVAPPVLPTALPDRAPGLWEQKVSSDGVTQASQLCLDRAVAERFTVWGQNAGRKGCTPAKVTTRAGGGFDFTTDCDLGENGKSSTVGAVTGDLARAYKVSAQHTVTGAKAPQMNGRHAMTLDAVWKGPCPSGMVPGDVRLPGGVKLNMLKIPHG